MIEGLLDLKKEEEEMILMRFDIISAIPDAIQQYLSYSINSIAEKRKLLNIISIIFTITLIMPIAELTITHLAVVLG